MSLEAVITVSVLYLWALQ